MAQNYDIKGFEYQVHRLVPCSLHGCNAKEDRIWIHVCQCTHLRSLLYRKRTSHIRCITRWWPSASFF